MPAQNRDLSLILCPGMPFNPVSRPAAPRVRRPFGRLRAGSRDSRQDADATSTARGSGGQSSLVVRLRSGLKSFSIFAEYGVADNAGALEGELQSGCEHTEAILNAAAEIDGGGFLEILGGTGNFADAEAEIDALGEHLVVEDEIVAILPQRQAGEHVAAESAITGVILRQLDVQEQVLKSGEQAVGDVLVKRHASAQRSAAEDAGTENDVIHAVSDHARHGGYQQRRVLIIGMNHDDHVGAGGQSFAVASLLIAAVTVVAVVDEGRQAQPTRDFDSAIGTVVVDENADIDQVGQFPYRSFQRPFRIECREHHGNAFAVDHALLSLDRLRE